MRYLFYLIPLTIFLNACSKESSSENFENLDYFYNNSNVLKIDVAYEGNEKPYINSGFSDGMNFTFTANNLTQLLASREKPITVSIDKTITEMEMIPSQNKTAYTNDEILALSREYKPSISTASQNTLYVLFLNGYYNLNGNVLNQVIGIHVSDNTIAMFKPAIISISNSLERKHIEQRILLHEIGHALGLVDAGVPMQNYHLDTGNGKHCSNTACVMYKSHNGTMSGSVNEFVFGQECIADIREF